MYYSSYQSENNEKDLNDVCVSDRDESSKKSVTERNNSRHDDGDLLVEVQDDLESGAQSSQDGGRPEDLRDSGWQSLQCSPLAVFLREGINHRYILGIAHDLGKKCSA